MSSTCRRAKVSVFELKIAKNRRFLVTKGPFLSMSRCFTSWPCCIESDSNGRKPALASDDFSRRLMWLKDSFEALFIWISSSESSCSHHSNHSTCLCLILFHHVFLGGGGSDEPRDRQRAPGVSGSLRTGRRHLLLRGPAGGLSSSLTFESQGPWRLGRTGT